MDAGARSTEPCLTAAQLRALADLGRRGAGAIYGNPQDIEWALDADGRFWLTQARPITTLYPLPRAAAAGDARLLLHHPGPGLTRPITPMGLAAFRLIGASVATLAGDPPADR